MLMSSNTHSVNEHFENRAPSVRATYQAILKASKSFGPVIEDPKKTSIHLVRKTAFAGVSTSKTAMVLTLKSTSDIKSHRITRRQQASANRWYLYVRIESPKEVDDELLGWLRTSYDLSG